MSSRRLETKTKVSRLHLWCFLVSLIDSVTELPVVEYFCCFLLPGTTRGNRRRTSLTNDFLETFSESTSHSLNFNPFSFSGSQYCEVRNQPFFDFAKFIQIYFVSRGHSIVSVVVHTLKTPCRQIDIIGAMMIVWRVRGKNFFQVCCVQYCVQQLSRVQCTHT